MTLTHEAAVDFFSTLYRGEHHIPGRRWGGKENVRADGNGVFSVGHYCAGPGLSTFDYDELTRLVLLAHERCVRVSLRSGGPGSIRICIFGRDREATDMSETHPTIDEAVEKFRTNDDGTWWSVLKERAARKGGA